MDALALLEALFPDCTPKQIQNALEHPIEDAIRILEMGEETDELLQLKSMFPDLSDEQLFDAFSTTDTIEEAIDKLFQEPQEEQLVSIKSRKDMNIPLKKISALKAIFPQIAEDSIRDALVEADGSEEQAVQILFAVASDADGRSQFEHDMQQLRDIVPDVPDHILAKVYNQNANNVERTLDRLLQDRRNLESFSTVVGEQEHRPARIASVHVKDTPKVYKIDSKPTTSDIQDYQSRLNELAQERHQVFHRAMLKFKEGSLTGRGAAAYYADQGREIGQRMTALRQQTAKAIMQVNQEKHGDPDVVDLHGLTTVEAKAGKSAEKAN
ncbi:hypothetical protein EDD86DRAFT_263285 [Gorgonomyces haynaldii]|nr:hypothetical protein EDD86DRAFT_263285 [Gorgonomyces haynaldii]